MRGWLTKSSESMPGEAGGAPNDRLGLGAGLLTLAICVAADVLLTGEAAIAGTFVVAPFVAALVAGPAATAAVGCAAFAAAALSPLWNVTGEAEQVVRLCLLAGGSCLAVFGAWVRSRSAGRSERLRLLDSVGAVADGSLPLAETLRRVTEVIVPAFSDICMVDAIHDGRVSRIATRVRGHDDAPAIEERMRRRPPALPDWLVKFERSWRHIPQWLPSVRDEELRRMADSGEDLEFLRSLGLRSSIVVPIRARDRNLGTLTVIVAWSGRRYGAEDVRFAQILASRIGLALDNAGLFSDLESIERRMDTVMSILDEAIVIHGSHGELVFANPSAARMLGFESAEEAIAAPTASIRDRFVIRDEHGEAVESDLLAGRRALRAGSSEPQILRTIDRATGRERWTRTKAQAIVGPDGEDLYFVTAIEDVTDVKRAEFANRLLARTGELVSHSIDYRATLARVPELLVPEFADWCSIEMPASGGRIERVAMAHRDPAMLENAHAMRRRFPLFIEADTPVCQVLRSGEPLRIEVDAAHLEAASSSSEELRMLEDAGFRSVIVTPMVAGGRTVGVLSFINHCGGRSFDDDDSAIANEVARRAALAIENARLADEKARVADALQRELLPPSVPEMPGWEVATMYEPAGELNEVGGDFYEVFPVRGGWAVVLGDVSGKGAAAAALTAEARHTIRTAGILAADPVAGLHLLDRNLRDRDEVALCSVAMLVLPDSGAESTRVLVYLAGHPHPMLLRGDYAAPVGEPGPLLGVVDQPSWPATAVSLAPGDQLVLYTDGVIEARRAGGERFGSERLRAGLAGCAGPMFAVERVRSALAEFGAHAREDDAAVVAIRRGWSGDRGEALSRAGAARAIPAA